MAAVSDERKGGGGSNGDGGRWVPKTLTGEYRADSEDAVAISATADRLRAIAPLLRGVSSRRSQLEYLRLATQFDEIAESAKAIAEGLRLRAEIKFGGNGTP